MMAESHESAVWGRESIVMFLLHCVFRLNCDPKHAPKARTPEDFNPFAKKAEPIQVPISTLRDVFCKPKKGKPKSC